MAASSRQYPCPSKFRSGDSSLPETFSDFISSFVLCDRKRCLTVKFFCLLSFFSRIVGILIFSDLTFLPLLGTSWVPVFLSWITFKLCFLHRKLAVLCAPSQFMVSSWKGRLCLV